MKLHVFKSSGERTYNHDNENIYHAKFAWYAERSSFANINPKSYHLIAFELVNPLLYIYLECRIFWKDLESTLLSSVALWSCDFVTSLIPRLRNHNAIDDDNVDFRSF